MSVDASVQRRIELVYRDFILWLFQSELINDRLEIQEITFDSFGSDELLVVDNIDNNNVLRFNYDYYDKCKSIDFFLITVLHETYHVYINKIPNKKDAKRIKDFYQDRMMLHIDVEADCYTAQYFRDRHDWTFDRYLRVYYEGLVVFRDPEIRPLKFERFLCSMHSLAELFFRETYGIYRISSESVRIHKGSPYAIIHREKVTEVVKLYLSMNDLEDMQIMYQYGTDYSVTEYVTILHEVLQKSIGVKLKESHYTSYSVLRRERIQKNISPKGKILLKNRNRKK
jgi:hypothetical protein